MRCTFLILFCALGLAAASVQADDKADAAKALKKFQGTWTFESVVVDGKKESSVWGEELKNLKITFAGNKFTVKKGDKVVQAGTQKLDPSKSPKAVDATVTEGNGKGRKMLGIYEIEGDILKVCFDPEGKKRPTEFKSTAGSGIVVVVHKRARK
jgi:uncharacterized protein (TIGR03067 family)